MIYDLRRTRGIAAILLTIAAIMAVYGLILNAALRPADGLLHEQTQDTGGSTKVRLRAGLRRLLGLLSPDLAQPLQPDQRLGLLLGPSVLWTGIDPLKLGADLEGPYRWANIPSTKHAEDYLFLTKMIYSQGLKPDVLILVTNPGVLVTTIDEEEARASSTARSAKSRRTSRKSVTSHSALRSRTMPRSIRSSVAASSRPSSGYSRDRAPV
jgi:hypothetical protein